jgi:hypothetical protein
MGRPKKPKRMKAYIEEVKEKAKKKESKKKKKQQQMKFQVISNI